MHVVAMKRLNGFRQENIMDVAGYDWIWLSCKTYPIQMDSNGCSLRLVNIGNSSVSWAWQI